MASEWYDYNEYKNYLYELWKSGEWDKLDIRIKRFLWIEKQKLLGEANADMEIGGSDKTDLRDLRPNSDNGNKKSRKKRKKRGYLRTYSIEQAMEDGIDYPYSSTPEDFIIQQETNQELYTAINTLDETDKDIITLHYFEDLKERQIEKIVNMKQKTVNNHKHKSLKTMRKTLEKNQ